MITTSEQKSLWVIKMFELLVVGVSEGIIAVNTIVRSDMSKKIVPIGLLCWNWFFHWFALFLGQIISIFSCFWLLKDLIYANLCYLCKQSFANISQDTSTCGETFSPVRQILKTLRSVTPLIYWSLRRHIQNNHNRFYRFFHLHITWPALISILHI